VRGLLCWFCNKVKGKRSCPARSGQVICSRCCGTKRRVEIACPEDCPYLFGEHDSRWESQARLSEQARFAASFVGLPEKTAALLALVHVLLLQARRALGGELSDREAEQVVAALARTYETLSKGIIYQHQVDSPRLQGVVDRMIRFLQERERFVPPTSDDDVLASLRALETALSTHRAQAGSGRSYLDLAARTFKEQPELELKEGVSPRLIVQP
jgi:hypothetical protein